MPQVDLENLVCGGGGDGKVVCETMIDGGARRYPPSDDPDFPAESFQIPIDYEMDWVDRNATFYDRDGSTKGVTNPKSHQANPNIVGSNSQHFSGNLRPMPPIIGIPQLPHSGYLGGSARKTGRHSAGRILPKKPRRPGGKSAVLEEPGSPKVSCFGKVLSGRESNRYGIPHQGENPREAEEKTGFWARLFGYSCCGETRAVEDSVEPNWWRKDHPATEKTKFPRTDEALSAAPGLGGMKRFASGRRAASWGGDVDLGIGDHVDVSEPLDRESIWGRRSVGSLEDVRQDWESSGPPSS